jgi:hypothetical protein
MLIKIIEFSALALLVYFLLTQVIIPAFLERKLFPIFRKTGALEQELVAARQDVADAELAKKVEEVKSEK